MQKPDRQPVWCLSTTDSRPGMALVYFTLIFFPARIPDPLMPFSRLSFFTVVWLRAAISESVSPLLTVTLLLRAERFLLRLPRLWRLLRELLLRVWVPSVGWCLVVHLHFVTFEQQFVGLVAVYRVFIVDEHAYQ